MKPGAIYLNSARALLHDTDALVAALQSGHLGGAGLDHFEGEHLATDHPLCAMENVVLTPHIGGATYDTEANHSKLIADDRRAARAATSPSTGQPGGARRERLRGCPPTRSRPSCCGWRRRCLRTNLVHGTAGNFSARLPDGNVVLTPSSLDYWTMTLDDLVVCDLDGNVLEGTRGPTTEKMLHLARCAGHDNIDATMHCHAKFSHDVRAHPTSRSRRSSRSSTCSSAATCPVADYRTTGSDELADEVASRVGEKAAVLMANHGLFTVGKNPKDVLHIAALVERTAEIVWGAQALGTIVPLPPR